MPRENVLTTLAARLAAVPFVISRKHTFHAPHKALILQPCCLSQVMLTTPLLAALSEAFPKARFDWAVDRWSRPAVAGNSRVTEIVDLGEMDLMHPSWRQLAQLIRLLRPAHYDTVFIPSRSALLSLAAWQGGIHQRVGLNAQGRGFAHTLPVTPPRGLENMGAQALLLAEAVGVERSITGAASMEFRPSSLDRTVVTRLLVEDLDWLGDKPLVVLNTGGGVNPSRSNLLVRWPSERFVILGNYLAQEYGARVIVVGSAEEKTIAREITGMMAGRVENYCGRLSLGELSALCEVADLYVGNDAGTSHIAAAAGCQTIVIYGPTNPAYFEPYSVAGNVHTLCRNGSAKPAERPFSWAAGVTAEEAMTAADQVLKKPADRGRTLAILSRRPGEKN